VQRSNSFRKGTVCDQLPSFFQIHSKQGAVGAVPFDSQHMVTIHMMLFQNCDNGPVGDCQEALGIYVLCNRTGCS
jgi:hypothetical protein